MIYFSTRMIDPSLYEDRLVISVGGPIRDSVVHEVSALCALKNEGVLRDDSLCVYSLSIDSCHRLPLKIAIEKGAILYNDDDLIDVSLPTDKIKMICERDILFLRIQSPDSSFYWMVLQFTYFDED